MSVTFGVSLVDWSEFLDCMRAGAAGGLARLDCEEFVERFPAEDVDYDQYNWRAEFMEGLDRLRERWHPPGMQRAYQVLYALLGSDLRDDWMIKDADIPPQAIPYPLESAWSPDTVRKFAALWRQADLSGAKPYFQPVLDGHDPFETFEEFLRFAQEYGGVLERGARLGKGLIVVCHV